MNDAQQQVQLSQDQVKNLKNNLFVSINGLGDNLSEVLKTIRENKTVIQAALASDEVFKENVSFKTKIEQSLNQNTKRNVQQRYAVALALGIDTTTIKTQIKDDTLRDVADIACKERDAQLFAACVNEAADQAKTDIFDAVKAGNHTLGMVKYCFENHKNYFTQAIATQMAKTYTRKPPLDNNGHNFLVVRHLIEEQGADRGKILNAARKYNNTYITEYIESAQNLDRLKYATVIAPFVVGGATAVAAYFLSTAVAVQIAAPVAAFVATLLVLGAILKHCDKQHKDKTNLAGKVILVHACLKI